MKKSSKIILLVLALSLLIGGVIGISASADTVAPEIISKNVKTDGNFCLMFAVDPATVAGDEVTVTVYNQNPADLDADALAEATVQTITKAKTDTETIALGADGVKDDVVIVFETLGVAAKDIADVWYVKTESAEKSKIVTYSVREYAFERLYKDGTVNATENDADLKKFYQKRFYLELLDMGSAAQELHVNYKLVANGETPERLAKEYTYAFIKDGSYSIGDADAVSYGFVEVGDTLTLTGESGWNVYTYGQNGGSISTQVVANGGTVTVAGNMIITPYEIGVTAGKYFDEIGDPMYKFDTMTYRNFVGESGTHYLSKSGFSTTGNFLYAFKDSGDEEHGVVLALSKNDQGGGPTLSAPIDIVTSEKANCVVFEYDFMYTKADFYYSSGDIKAEGQESLTEPFIVAFNSENLEGTANSKTKTQWLQFRAVDYDSTFVTNSIGTGGGDALRLPGATDKTYDILPNEWHTITYEIYTDVAKVVVYLDGEAVSVSTAGSNARDVANLNSITFTFDYRVRNCEMMFDNMVGLKIEKEFVDPFN